MEDQTDSPILKPVLNLSIRSRIIVFSILITFLPASGLGWLFYHNNQEMIAENAEHELVSASRTTHIAVSQWFQARGYDIKVFSSSFVVTENLANFYRKPGASEQSKQDIADYFALLLDQFESISALLLFDQSGKLIVSTEVQPQLTVLDSAWMPDAGKMPTAQVSVNAAAGSITISMPVTSSSQELHGWIAGVIPVSEFVDLIETTLPRDIEHWLLVGTSGTSTHNILHGSIGLNRPQHVFSPSELEKAFSDKDQLVEMADIQSQTVYAIATEIENFPLDVVLLRTTTDVYADVDRLKNMSYLLTAMLMLITGILAIGLARSILKPLTQLKLAAKAVSEGNLSVNVSQLRDDELGQVVKVFNEMVENLALTHNELELLSITDPLTGLFNRERMMSLMTNSVERYRRYHQVFSVIMVDIDHFKMVNDQYGHQAGDAVLEKIGQIFMSELRTIDVAARYGGEEFIILLDQVDVKAAFQTAERIRIAVENTDFEVGAFSIGCTLSLGVTTMSREDQTEADLIGEADAALYIAKGAGRNQTMVALDNVVIESESEIPEPKTRRKRKAVAAKDQVKVDPLAETDIALVAEQKPASVAVDKGVIERQPEKPMPKPKPKRKPRAATQKSAP